jgi:hypothetical protein
MDQARRDPTTPDTRLADYLLDFNPAATNALAKLMLGGYLEAGRIWTLHCRFRYFDPVGRRAGLPPDVAALVEQLSADSATLTLVNINPIDARTVIVQGGAYGEHQFESAAIDGQKFELSSAAVPVRIEPGCGARIQFRMARYKNQPTLAQPWDRN